MPYLIEVDLGRTTHRFALPPWIDSEHEARRFHGAISEGLWCMEPVELDSHWLAVVLHEGTEHGLAIPARNYDQACEVLEAIAVGQLCRVS